MKILLLALVLILASPMAHAEQVNKQGSDAESFMDQYFPDHDAGPVQGQFIYVNSEGEYAHGYASCYQTTGHSETLSYCDITY